MSKQKTGKLFILSGPSGSGKSTILRRVFEKMPEVHFSISATTRTPRPGEIEGEHYYFVSEADFLQMKDASGLLESNYHFGNWYGTPQKPIETLLQQGQDVLLDIEVEGAAQVKGKLPQAVTIFLFPPTMEELERRLRLRGTDTEEKVIKRLSRAREESAKAMFYDYLVINDDLDDAITEVLSIIVAEGCKLESRRHLIEA